MTDKRDFYDVLGVARTASGEEIKRSYRALARRYHPDVNKESGADARFKEINEAYEVLSSDQKRATYDRYGVEGLTAGPGFGGFGTGMGGFGDIFDVFFGGSPGSRARTTGPVAEPGDDLRVDLEVTLEEAALGTSKTVKFGRMQGCDACSGSGAKPGTVAENCPTCRGMGYVRHTQNTLLGTFQTQTTCPRCRGEGSVVQSPCVECGGVGRSRKPTEHVINIPAGVDSGTRLRLHGEGDSGIRGGRSGDLDLVIHVRKHPMFERRGSDLWCEVTVSFTRAALGGRLRVPTIYGEDEFDLPEGTQPGDQIKIKDRGMPILNGRGRGDQCIIVNVQVPTKLTAEQKRFLKQFAGSLGERVDETDHGRLGRILKGEK